MSKIVGVLGGMGPEATVYFMQRLIELTPAKKDQEHIRLIVDNNPQIPDRTEAICSGGASPIGPMIESSRLLEKTGAEFICIPCNTAHFWLDEIRNSVDIPVLDMVERTLQKVIEQKLNTVGLLATTGTITSNLYNEKANKLGVSVVTPVHERQKELMGFIRRIKSREDSKKIISKRIEKICNALIKKGAEGIIIGCTEISLVLRPENSKVQIFDSLEILANEVIRQALNL